MCINTHTYIYIICIYICIYIYIDRERAGDGGNEYSSEKSYVSYACSHKPVYEYIYIYVLIEYGMASIRVCESMHLYILMWTHMSYCLGCVHTEVNEEDEGDIESNTERLRDDHMYTFPISSAKTPNNPSK